jgi:hypothetical protein
MPETTKRMQQATDTLGCDVKQFILALRQQGKSWLYIRNLLRGRGIQVGCTALINSWSVRA